MFTIHDKCLAMVGTAMVIENYKKLCNQREGEFLGLFKKHGVENRVKIHASVGSIPYNGFSYYKIEYKGEYPQSLIKANEKMNQLNSNYPRKKYEEKRNKLAN
jgi:hypothetical protein